MVLVGAVWDLQASKEGSLKSFPSAFFSLPTCSGIFFFFFLPTDDILIGYFFQVSLCYNLWTLVMSKVLLGLFVTWSALQCKCFYCNLSEGCNFLVKLRNVRYIYFS